MDLLFKEGKALSQPPFRVLFIAEARSEEARVPMLQFGVGASSRNFKKAVDRNLIKRRVREAYRQHKGGLMQALSAQGLVLRVFFIYTAREIPEWEPLNAKMQLALQKLEKEVGRFPRS
jgi:ribonuclease P protein component